MNNLKKRILESASAQKEQGGRTPSLHVEQKSMLSKHVAKVWFSHEPGQFNERAIERAFAKDFNGLVKLVPDSIRYTSNAGRRQHGEAIVLKNTPSEPFEAGKNARLTVIAANVFSDEANKIWRKVGDGENSRLVLETDDDLEEVLSARRSLIREFASLSQVEPKSGHYALYFNLDEEEVRGGYLLKTTAGLKVIDRRSAQEVVIDPLQVIETATGFDPEFEPVADRDRETAMDSKEATKVVDYMRKLYGNSTLFVELEKRIRGSNSVLGRED